MFSYENISFVCVANSPTVHAIDSFSIRYFPLENISFACSMLTVSASRIVERSISTRKYRTNVKTIKKERKVFSAPRNQTTNLFLIPISFIPIIRSSSQTFCIIYRIRYIKFCSTTSISFITCIIPSTCIFKSYIFD